ncbi:MAG: hypothetical protein HY077_08140 [Elusimicrobia bacterium]|nr:hypothetical protein [Elusimicrobiota bacterium]
MKKRPVTTLSTFLAALFFFVLLPIFPGCAGGCGEDTATQSAAKPQEGAAGGGSSSSSGGGQATLSRYDSAKKGAMGQAGEVGEQLAASPVKPLTPQDFKPTVLRAGTTVLLTVVRPDCPDCDAILPVLDALAPEFKGRYAFYRFDGAAVGASGLLSPKVSLEPLPAFVMYKNGKATSWLQGLPFPREVDASGSYTESLEGYQRRLMRWFHDALAQKNLNFSRTIRKAPPKKT